MAPFIIFAQVSGRWLSLSFCLQLSISLSLTTSPLSLFPSFPPLWPHLALSKPSSSFVPSPQESSTFWLYPNLSSSLTPGTECRSRPGLPSHRITQSPVCRPRSIQLLLFLFPCQGSSSSKPPPHTLPCLATGHGLRTFLFASHEWLIHRNHRL